jgi:heme exporter protein A
MSPLPLPVPLPAPASLEGRQLSCQRGRRLLFEGLDISLAAGSLTWLRGANGSGKTSLMRILAGLSTPVAGEVLLNGQALHKAGPQARQSVAYVGHANALKDDLSLQESLAFLARLAGMDQPEDRASHALDKLGLGNRRKALVRTLSQGQRRRGALARLALDDQARTWILDEPYDALDADSMGRLSDLICTQAARGGAVLLTSHQPVSLPGLREHLLQPRPAS